MVAQAWRDRLDTVLTWVRYESVPWCRRRRRVEIVVAIAAVLGVCGLGWGVVQLIPEHDDTVAETRDGTLWVCTSEGCGHELGLSGDQTTFYDAWGEDAVLICPMCREQSALHAERCTTCRHLMIKRDVELAHRAGVEIRCPVCEAVVPKNPGGSGGGESP